MANETEMLSQCYTTKWRDIPLARLGSLVISEHIFSVSSGLVFTAILDRLCSVRGVLQSTDVWRPVVFPVIQAISFQPKKHLVLRGNHLINIIQSRIFCQ